MQWDLEEVVMLAEVAQRIQRAWRRHRASKGMSWAVLWHRHHLKVERAGPWAASTIQRHFRMHRRVRMASCAILWAMQWHRASKGRIEAATHLQRICRGARERRHIVRPKRLARRSLIEKREEVAGAERNWAVAAAREARFADLGAALVKELATGTDDFLNGEELGGEGRAAPERVELYRARLHHVVARARQFERDMGEARSADPCALLAQEQGKAAAAAAAAAEAAAAAAARAAVSAAAMASAAELQSLRDELESARSELAHSEDERSRLEQVMV